MQAKVPISSTIGCHEIIRSLPPLSVDFFTTKKFGCPTTPKITLSDKLYFWLKITKTYSNPHWNICAHPRGRVTYFCLGDEKTWCFLLLACVIFWHICFFRFTQTRVSIRFILNLSINNLAAICRRATWYGRPISTGGRWKKIRWKLMKRLQKIDIQTGTMSASL